jgi:hypothetical protein
MKILSVLALLFGLCAAYEDFTYVSIANSTQAYGSVNKDSPGTCTTTLTRTGLTLTGTGTCTGLKGAVTLTHIHCVNIQDPIAYNTGTTLDPVCKVTYDNATGLTVNCDFTDQSGSTAGTDALNAICADRFYINIHTDYENNGEVRGNLVGLKALCLFKDGAPKDGTLVVADASTTPTAGNEVASFCGTWFAVQPTTVTGSNAAGYVTVCWDSTQQTLTFSGVFYNFATTDFVTGIYLQYPGDSTYFLSLSSSFAPGIPFSFIQTTIDDWVLAKVASSKATILIATTDYSYSNGGELSFSIIPKTGGPSFPANDAPCYPTTTLPIDKTKVLTCYVGTSSLSTSISCPAGYFCGIESDEDKVCASPDSCYTCDCDKYKTSLPTLGYYCCDTSDCNSGTFPKVDCPTTDGAGSISIGLLVSLFVALLMKWFN